MTLIHCGICSTGPGCSTIPTNLATQRPLNLPL
ncbi:hypothetical protein PITC_056430 [Penicillium italicum]|uniref:Uncharacterized protein n=1 Tax=Penicillium italicum TaxID=40296 RepID=A0A0A2KXW9_PENIT|nr:hypothetical protein PITC_056430 [Penicillium italicum]